MLSAEMLDLLRQWWKARLSRGDAGMPVEERWLFPGKSRGKPMTTRQLNRLFHQAVDAAGIRKGMTLHRPAPQLCDPPAGTRHRYQSHPMPAWWRSSRIYPAVKRLAALALNAKRPDGLPTPLHYAAQAARRIELAE